jgi:hypothetical protein
MNWKNQSLQPGDTVDDFVKKLKIANQNPNALERQAKAAKYGRKIKAEVTKSQILQTLIESELNEWDMLQIAYNHGYSQGFKDGETPYPLYNKKGKQIREVTQSELDWSY